MIIIRRKRSIPPPAEKPPLEPVHGRPFPGPTFPVRRWDPRRLRSEVEGEFREHGARVWREEKKVG